MNCKKIITIVIIAIIAMSSIFVELNAKEVNTASFTLMPGSSRISPVYGFVTKTAGDGTYTIPFENCQLEIFFKLGPTEFSVNVETDENGYYCVPIPISPEPDHTNEFRVVIEYWHYSPWYNYTGGHRLDIRVDQVM
jgi:hypothetical protein